MLQNRHISHDLNCRQSETATLQVAVFYRTYPQARGYPCLAAGSPIALAAPAEYAETGTGSV